MTTEKKEPKIGDIVRIVCISSGRRVEMFGRIEGYQTNDFGIYVKISGQAPVFMKSIMEWEILTSNSNNYDNSNTTR